MGWLDSWMRKARHILAVMAVTTALCADQMVAAAPLPRPQMADVAARVIERLAQPFRRTVPNAVRPITRTCTTVQPVAPAERPAEVPALHCELSPFQFRLPPPLA
jgi:hypothetical protein